MWRVLVCPAILDKLVVGKAIVMGGVGSRGNGGWSVLSRFEKNCIFE